MKVIVYHTYYGCETGCCGHAIKVDGAEEFKTFDFDHPDARDDREWAIRFARKAVDKKYGVDHTFDLDWEHCTVQDDLLC